MSIGKLYFRFLRKVGILKHLNIFVKSNVNNRKITADTLRTYNEEIDIFIQEDTNFIKISPMQGTVDLASMAIFYWDKD